MLVSSAQIERFRHDGFVVIDGLLTETELENIRRRGRSRGRRSQARRCSCPRQKSLYEQSFTQCMNLWEDNPEVLPLTFHPKISEAAATLIGVPAAAPLA